MRSAFVGAVAVIAVIALWLFLSVAPEPVAPAVVVPAEVTPPPPGPAVAMDIVAPSALRGGQPFQLRTRLLDAAGNVLSVEVKDYQPMIGEGIVPFSISSDRPEGRFEATSHPVLFADDAPTVGWLDRLGYSELGEGPAPWGEQPDGLTAIEADDLTREGVTEALRQGRAWTTTGERTLLQTRWTDSGVRVRFVSAATPEALEVVGDGEVIARVEAPEPGLWLEIEAPSASSRYVRLILPDGARAWAAAP